MTRSTTTPALDAEAISRIDAAITRAETRTSGEIIAVLTARSGFYLHAPLVGGLFGAALAVAVVSAISFAVHRELPQLHVGWWCALTLGGFVLGFLLARLDALERALAGRQILLAECEQKARNAFHDHGLFKTKGSSGVMIFVSLFERTVLVIGDTEVDAKLGSKDYRSVVDAMLPLLGEGRLEAAFTTGIERVADLLAPHFPRAKDDVNELPDRLYVL